MAARRIAAVVLAVALPVATLSSTVAGQEPSSTSTTLADLPDQDIVPQPNTGEEPHDPGDRGGALQLAVLAMVVVGVGGAVTVVVRQARRARPGEGSA